MNSIISVLMALMMALSMVGGVTGNVAEPITHEVAIDVDSEAFVDLMKQTTPGMADLDEQTQAQAIAPMKMAADVLNVLGGKLTIGQNAIEVAVTAEGDTLLSLASKTDETGVTLGSNLLGDQVLTMSAETIRKMMETMMSQMGGQGENSLNIAGLMEKLQSLDKEKIAADLSEISNKMITEFTSKIGEPETGEFTVGDHAYTTKIPVNITIPEMVEILANTCEELLEKDYVQEIGAAVHPGRDVKESVVKKLEELKAQAKESDMESEIAVYADQDGCNCTILNIVQPAKEYMNGLQLNIAIAAEANGSSQMVFDMATGENGEMTAHFDMTGTATGEFVMNGELNGMMKATMNMTAGADKAQATINVETQYGPMKMLAEADQAEGNAKETVQVFFGESEKPLMTVTSSAVQGGEISTRLSGEDMKVLAVEEMTAEDSNSATILMTTLMTNGMQALTNLISHLPEDTGAMLSAMLNSMMAPAN